MNFFSNFATLSIQEVPTVGNNRAGRVADALMCRFLHIHSNCHQHPHYRTKLSSGSGDPSWRVLLTIDIAYL